MMKGGIESNNSFLCFICGRKIVLESDKEKDFHVNSCLDLQEGGEREQLSCQKENTENLIVCDTSTISIDKEKSNPAYSQTVSVSESKNIESNSRKVNMNASDPPAGSKKSKTLVNNNTPANVNISVSNPPKAKRKPRSATAGIDTNKKLELEFHKLSNLAQINFLQSKMGILQHISSDALLKPDTFMEFAATECMDDRVISSEIINTTTLNTAIRTSTISADAAEALPKQPSAITAISSLRLELGEILAKEAELKAKEKKIRAAIKKMQRSLQLSGEFKKVEGAERDPVSYALQLLFPVNKPCNIESLDESSSGSSSSGKRPLWHLSFQREDFDCLAETKRVRQERDAVLVSEDVIIAVVEHALTQQVIVTEEDTTGTSMRETERNHVQMPDTSGEQGEKSLFSQLVDELNGNDNDGEGIHSIGGHCSNDKSITSSTAQLLHEEYRKVIDTFMRSVGTWGRSLPETGVKYLEDTIIRWEQSLDTRVPLLQSIVTVFDNWRSELSEPSGLNDLQFERVTHPMWSKTAKDFTDDISSYFERVTDESREIDSLLYRDMHSLVAISLKILSLLFNLQPSQDQSASPGNEGVSECAHSNLDYLRNEEEEAIEKESVEAREGENSTRQLSPLFEQSHSIDSSPDVISISPSLPPLTQKRQRSANRRADSAEIICLISPPAQMETVLVHSVGGEKDLTAIVDDVPSDKYPHDERSQYDPYYNDFQWDDDYIYSAVDFYEPEKYEVGSSDAAVDDIDLRNDGDVHADVTLEREVGEGAASQPSHSGSSRAVAEGNGAVVESQQLDVLQSDREPSFESMQVYALRDICLQYGLKTDSSRDKMISILRALWRRMHPTPSSSSSSSSSLSQNPSHSSQVMSHILQSSSRHDVRDRVEYAAATLHSSSALPSSKDHHPHQHHHHHGTLSQESHLTAKSKKPKLCKDDLVHFIRRDDKLYEQVLLFVPVDLDPLHSTIKIQYDVSKTKLRQFLDELKVFVSGPSSSTSKTGARR